MTDFKLADHGSLCLLFPQTEEAHEWVAECISDEAQTYAGGIAIERRCVPNIIEGIQEDGLTIEEA